MKDRLGLIILSLFIVTNINGQNAFLFEIYGSIGNNSYFVNPDFSNTISYKSSISNSLGVRIGILIKDRYLFKSGVSLSWYGYSINYNWIVMEPNDPAIPNITRLNASFIDIPVLIGYGFNLNNRLSIYPEIGINFSLLYNVAEESTYGADSNRESNYLERNMSAFFIEPNLKVCFGYNLNNNWSFGIEPYIGKFITKFDKLYMGSGHLSYGISVSINYLIE